MSEFVESSKVFVDNPATTRDEVLQFLSEKAAELTDADQAAQIRAAFDAREAEGSTGMAGGFAIPHAKTNAVDEPMVMVVKTAQPVADWSTMDNKPVEVAIALLIPDTQAGTEHLRLLSRTAMLLMRPQFCEAILETDDPARIAHIIDEGLEH